MGPLDVQPYLFEHKYQQANAMRAAKEVILEISKEFEKMTGRKYSLSKAKAVAILDKADSVNGAGGALYTDVTSAMFTNGVNVPAINYVYGIGGRDTTSYDIEGVYNDLMEIAKIGKVENPYRYFGLRREK